MEWVYETPLNKDERVLEQVLRKHLLNKDYSLKILRLLSLIRFLKSRKFKNPREIRNSFFYDKAKTKPIFDEESSKEIFQKLTKRGGQPASEAAIEAGIETLIEKLPDSIGDLIGLMSRLAKMPMGFITGLFGPELTKLGVSVVENGAKLGSTVMYDIGADLGGPFGVAAAAIPALIISGSSAALTAANGDLGKSVMTMLNSLPFFGTMLTQTASSVNSLLPKILKSADEIKSRVPFAHLVTDVLPDPPEFLDKVTSTAGGKRFSSRKRKRSKWVTQRRK